MKSLSKVEKVSLTEIELEFELDLYMIDDLIPHWILCHGNPTIITNHLVNLVLPIDTRYKSFNKRTNQLLKTFKMYDRLLDSYEGDIRFFNKDLIKKFNNAFDNIIEWRYTQLFSTVIMSHIAIGSFYKNNSLFSIYMQGSIVRIKR